MGSGWGGPVRDAGTGRQRAPAASLITADMARRSHTPEAEEARRGTIASREEMLIKLSDIARFAQPTDMVRVHAALVHELPVGGVCPVGFNTIGPID